MTSMTAPRASGAQMSRAYQTLLIGLLGVNLGFVFLDRFGFGLLAPMIQPEFSLSNAQVGMVAGVLGATWALSSFGLATKTDGTVTVQMIDPLEIMEEARLAVAWMKRHISSVFS